MKEDVKLTSFRKTPCNQKLTSRYFAGYIYIFLLLQTGSADFTVLKDEDLDKQPKVWIFKFTTFQVDLSNSRISQSWVGGDGKRMGWGRGVGGYQTPLHIAQQLCNAYRR